MSFNTNVEYDYEENMWIFILEGEMDIYTSDIFKEQAIKSFEEKEADLLINGEKLNYIDSTGLGALIGILKMLQKSDHKIYLTNIKPNIRKLFDITELDKLFTIRGENNE
ncbi:MAG: STAS domain-containing protein [Tissierellia bacterium]|nr:STAS domain-containing protein [Tissierellia bacterium]MDD4725692.1 STAS domain-containing protein [Tissierellia bacterium]